MVLPIKSHPQTLDAVQRKINLPRIVTADKHFQHAKKPVIQIRIVKAIPEA